MPIGHKDAGKTEDSLIPLGLLLIFIEALLKVVLQVSSLAFLEKPTPRDREIRIGRIGIVQLLKRRTIVDDRKKVLQEIGVVASSRAISKYRLSCPVTFSAASFAANWLFLQRPLAIAVLGVDRRLADSPRS